MRGILACLAAVLLGLALRVPALAGDPKPAMGQLQQSSQLSQQANQGGTAETQSNTAAQAFEGGQGGTAGPGVYNGSNSPGAQEARGGTPPQESKAERTTPRYTGSSGGGGGVADAGNVTPYQEWVDKSKALLWAAVALLAAAWVVSKLGARVVAQVLCGLAAAASIAAAYFGFKVTMANQTMQGGLLMMGGALLTAISVSAAFAGGSVGAGGMLMAAITPLLIQITGKMAKKSDEKSNQE